MPTIPKSKRETFAMSPQQAKFPGVGAYDMSGWVRKSNVGNSPSYAIGKQKKDYSYKTEGPGVGQYVIDKAELSIHNTAHKGLQIGSRYRNRIVSEGPGPGTYGKQNSQTSKDKFSFTKSKKMYEGPFKTPGVGDYDVQIGAMRNTCGNSYVIQKCRFGRARRTFTESDSYFNFKSGQNLSNQKHSKLKTEEPGPGSYSVMVRYHKKGGIFPQSKRIMFDSELKPGPADYSYQTYKKINSPKVIIGSAPRQTSPQKQEETPGPNLYAIPSVIKYKKKDAMAIIGTEQRLNSRDKEGIPGPGAYNLLRHEDRHGATILSRHPIENHDKIPGPADYDPKVSSILRSTHGFTMGHEKKFAETKFLELPGPGTYRDFKKFTNRSHQFQKQKRPIGN